MSLMLMETRKMHCADYGRKVKQIKKKISFNITLLIDIAVIK